ncbi:MAG: cytochrome P450 [Pseudomonadota bacterium]
MSEPLYRPPAPKPLAPLPSLLRVMREGDGNLLSLVPRDAYRKSVTPLGYSRRSIILINEPDAIRNVMTDPLRIYPKNDLFVGALAPLVGDSIFTSHGDRWLRQRKLIDPAFSQMRLQEAFVAMRATLEDYFDQLDRAARDGTQLSLDVLMSQLTADVICRTLFSAPLSSDRAAAVFNDFAIFERSVASVNLGQLIFGKPWSDVRQPQAVLDACERIRNRIRELLAPRFTPKPGTPPHNDIVQAIIDARDDESGAGFSEEELIDQLGVFFLAGHETTASGLTWSFFILSQQPAVEERLVAETTATCGADAVDFASVKQLKYVRAVFRETLRLYPPITFIPRVAAETTRIAGRRIKRGAMIMISPWATHRNALLWNDPDRFDPDRFLDERAAELRNNVFLSFGLGPRICVGAGFATIEATLILSELSRRYRFVPAAPHSVRPVARLTTRPAREILCTVERRA